MAQYTYADERAERLAVGLGWFSVALGVAEVAAPRAVARLIGARPTDTTESTLRTFGFREIANGVAILREPERARWLWSRVGGDAVDLSFLGASLTSEDAADRGRAIAAAAAVLGVTVLDVIAARRLSGDQDEGRRSTMSTRSVRVEQVTTINRPIEQVYDFWRRFENLPQFMRHLVSVEQIGDRRSRWRAKAPAGMTVEWDAELVEERENEWIAWRSLEGSTVENSGSVRFVRAPGARGTELRVQLQYRPPAGALGRGIAWLFGEEPDQQIREDLCRFKQLMETGEIAVSDGPGLWRAAQPPSSPEQLKDFVGVHP
jgi:uncharacterized membrane protein